MHINRGKKLFLNKEGDAFTRKYKPLNGKQTIFWKNV